MSISRDSVSSAIRVICAENDRRMNARANHQNLFPNTDSDDEMPLHVHYCTQLWNQIQTLLYSPLYSQ